MTKEIFNSDRKSHTLIGFEKKAALAIKNHFGLTNFQMLVLSWLKGLWTGVLLSLVLHYFISH